MLYWPLWNHKSQSVGGRVDCAPGRGVSGQSAGQFCFGAIRETVGQLLQMRGWAVQRGGMNNNICYPEEETWSGQLILGYGI